MAPFVALNCATMHPDRLEPELFGTEPGQVDGDGGGKVGTFEKADGGTLFLDEVADMPMEPQGKIVRVLQEQTFQRVGGDKRIAVDVRRSEERRVGKECGSQCSLRWAPEPKKNNKNK